MLLIWQCVLCLEYPLEYPLSGSSTSGADMNIPYATKTSACVSGLILAVMLSAAEYLGGWSYILLNVTGALWFPVSIAVFVHGRQTIDYKIEALRGHRPFTDIPKDITPRAIVWFSTTLVTAWALSHIWVKG